MPCLRSSVWIVRAPAKPLCEAKISVISPKEPVAFAAGTGAGIGAATAMLPGVVAGPGDFQDPGHHRYRAAWFSRAFFVEMLDDFEDVVF